MRHELRFINLVALSIWLTKFEFYNGSGGCGEGAAGVDAECVVQNEDL
jgi:hypothetical protein